MSFEENKISHAALEVPKKRSFPLSAAAVNLGGGLIFGYATGIFAIISQWQTDLTTCDNFLAKSACDGAEVIGGCVWVPAGTDPDATDEPTSEPTTVSQLSDVWLDNAFDIPSGRAAKVGQLTEEPSTPAAVAGECRYPGDAKRVCATLMTTDTCSAGQGDAKCAWNYDEKKCEPEVGWSPILAGLYSSLFVVGCALGGPLASLVLSRGGRKNGLYVIIALGVISQVTVSLGWQFNVYAVQVVGRFIAGLSGGMACVVSPIYAEEMFGRHEWIGTLFQLGCTTGIVLPALFGFILDPYNADGINSKFGHGVHTQGMLHVVIHIESFLMVVFLGIVAIVPESLAQNEESTPSSPASPASALTQQFADASIGSKLRQMCPFFLPIIGICGAQQLTGINAIMNYAPSIMSSAGLRPLAGNFYVMLWNWVTTPLAIPLVRCFKPKAMYYAGIVSVTIACFLAFIPSYPGIVSNEKAANWLSGAAIFLFVACFEIGVGPNFFILAQDMFPKHLQNFGTSLTIAVVMTFNVIINFMFPVMRKGLSGSENNMDKGQAFSFLVFGAAGALSVLCVFLTMPKLRSEKEATAAAAVSEPQVEDVAAIELQTSYA